MHIPHVGDTVLVHHKDCHSNGAQVVPAIVQQLYNVEGHLQDPSLPILCNLVAFPPFMATKQLGSVPFYQSTPLIPDLFFVGCWPKQERHTAHVGDPDGV